MGEEENEIPDTGAVFTFGKSRFAENLPSHFFIRNDPIVDISCGEEHTLIVCQNGRVFGFGGNEFGQLGLGSTSPVTKPSCVKSLKPEKVKKIVCGKSHSLALTGNGKLLAWGSNSTCQLGTSNEENSTTPKQVDMTGSDDSITSITAGAQHSALLTEGGKVYIWGSNSCGQLGLGDGIKKCIKPTPLPIKEKALQIACGYWHTLILTEEKYLLVFGEGKSGKLGLGGTSSVPIPIPLKFDKNVRSIAAGGHHNLAVTEEGDVYAWGNNEHGQLGFSEEKTEITNPILVTPLLNVRVSQISCGDRHSAFISDNGELYTCGESKYGKLCSDSESKSDIMGSRTLPFKVNRFKTLKVQKVACGGCHTMVLALPNISNKTKKHTTTNGHIEKTNKENELAKKSGSETTLSEGQSEISSTPCQASRATLPPLQKVPQKDSSLSDSEFFLKQNGEDKTKDDDETETETESTQLSSQESSQDSTITTESSSCKDGDSKENEVVSNEESDSSSNKESSIIGNREDQNVDPTTLTPDNVSRINSSCRKLIEQSRKKLKRVPTTEHKIKPNTNKTSPAVSLDENLCRKSVINRIKQEESSASLPCLNVVDECRLETLKNECSIPKKVDLRRLNATSSEKVSSNELDIISKPKEMTPKTAELNGINIKEKGKQPGKNAQCLYFSPLKLDQLVANKDMLVENISEEEESLSGFCDIDSKVYKNVENTSRKCWLNGNIDEDLLTLENECDVKMSNLKIFNTDEVLKKVLFESKSVEDDSEKVIDHNEEDNIDEIFNGHVDGKVMSRNVKNLEKYSEKENQISNCDIVYLRENNLIIDEDDGYENDDKDVEKMKYDFSDDSIDANSSTNSEFVYSDNKKPRPIASCPNSVKDCNETSLKRNEYNSSNKSGSSSMSRLIQKRFENEFGSSDSSTNLDCSVDEYSNNEFECYDDCVTTVEKNLTYKIDSGDKLWPHREDNISKAKDDKEDEFSKDSLMHRKSVMISNIPFDYCKLCGNLRVDKADKMEHFSNFRRATGNLFGNICTNLRSILQKPKSIRPNSTYSTKADTQTDVEENDNINEILDETEMNETNSQMQKECVNTNAPNTERMMEEWKQGPTSNVKSSLSQRQLKLIYLRSKVPVSEGTGSGVDMSSTVSAVSPASERKADITDNTKVTTQPEDEIQEDTKPDDEPSKSESQKSKNNNDSENSKETEANGQTKNKKQKGQTKNGKKQQSSVCVIL